MPLGVSGTVSRVLYMLVVCVYVCVCVSICWCVQSETLQGDGEVGPPEGWSQNLVCPAVIHLQIVCCWVFPL